MATKNVVIKVQSAELRAAKMEKVLAAQKAQQADKAAAKAAKAAKASKPGIIQTIYNTIVEADGKAVSRKDILDVLLTEFAGEGSKHTAETMSKTITAQLGTKRMMRMEREKQVVFDVTEDEEGNRSFAYSAV